MSRFTKHFYRPRFDGKEQERRDHLGELLRKARKHLELTQVEVAATLGYKRQYHISQIENGKRTLDPIELENFAHLYGKTLNDFATWRDDEPETEELQRRATKIKPKPLSKRAKKRLENLRKYGKPMPADVADALARKHFENPTIKESGEKS